MWRLPSHLFTILGRIDWWDLVAPTGFFSGHKRANHYWRLLLLVLVIRISGYKLRSTVVWKTKRNKCVERQLRKQRTVRWIDRKYSLKYFFLYYCGGTHSWALFGCFLFGFYGWLDGLFPKAEALLIGHSFYSDYDVLLLARVVLFH